ncbi:hypothetical protein PRIPAC_76294 [Pristionchus pacificus]|uniref:Acyltransferase n=1 Tax=Pristionchus pacificus TaxID=54126 RepID=A0A2A6C8G9_PRIPA|nr:hypothetical protein PRIPAC_76294 [Pristionchus pacificus]|eukprot:PDM74505.1 Acyltransferase [Pristionchus pacificus]
MFQKRNDIQGLRTIAIIGVVLFHLGPKVFANGFLGGFDPPICMFTFKHCLVYPENIASDFVHVLPERNITTASSCYLMSLILSREKSITGSVIANFYSRRFKRIVPLYSIMLASLAADLWWALPFAENIKNIATNNDYWSEVFNSPVLLHAWSLGVEIQYYLIVPLIMIFSRIKETRLFRVICFAPIIIASYLCHIFTPEAVSFGLVFSRMWQFLIGSIAFELEGVIADFVSYLPVHAADSEDSNTNNKKLDDEPRKFLNVDTVRSCVIPFSAYCITGFLLWLMLLSKCPQAWSRVLTTLVTGILLLLGKLSQIRCLANEIVVYIGDLSYMIYLTHWPIIILYKYYVEVQEEFSVRAYIFTTVVYLLIIIALVSGGMQKISEVAHISGSDREAIEWNIAQTDLTYFSRPNGCTDDTEAEQWTHYTEESALRGLCTGTGTAKVLVIGNSYGYRAFPVLHKLFAGRYSKLRLFSRSSRVLLTEDPGDPNFKNYVKTVLENFRPDITFLIEKDQYNSLTKRIVGDIAHDPITKQIHASIDFLSEHSGTLIVDQQYYKPELNVAYTLQKRLQMGERNFTDLRVRREKYQLRFENEIARMGSLNNSEVIVNDVQAQLCPGEYCYFYNYETLHAYYGDTAAHLTSEGLNQLEPTYSFDY